MSLRVPEDNSPLLPYTDHHLWANPEENQQYQVKLVRISKEYGAIKNYAYMNKWRILPKPDTFFHVYSVAGLDPAFWRFLTDAVRRNPLDRWVNISVMAKRQGIQLDIYTGEGYQYSRSHCWIMKTYDGLTLIAMEKLHVLPVPMGLDMYFRCYAPSIFVDENEDRFDSNPFIYETMTYANATELNTFVTRYNDLMSRPGFTGVFHNGAYFDGPPNAIVPLTVGDIVEIWHDPTVYMMEVYKYSDLKDFYSELDQKRKLILHPPRTPGDFFVRYFDDNDYFLIGADNHGLYFPRNVESAVRQLTHVDVSIAEDMIQTATEYHPALETLQNLKIMVLVRDTTWRYEWPHEHQRIRYLYRMPDVDIMKAFTGERANMPEWTASGLETGAVMGLNRSQWIRIKNEDALLAMGYNASTRVISETTHRVTYDPGVLGIDVPITYRGLMTAWEYDNNGVLLGYQNYQNINRFTPVDPNCAMVEFIMGNYAREVDVTITTSNVTLDKAYGFRVYIGPYDPATQTLGTLKDVTGDSTYYTIEGDVLTWKYIPVNQQGFVFSEKGTLAYSFTLDHIDHSLAFAITHIYEPGGLIFPFSFAEVDIWLNGHPLIDQVDWIYDDQYVYIHNKEFLIDGPQSITVRAYGYRGEDTTPNTDRELGFVDGGVIGRFDRYNLRTDRVTRTVIGGSLLLTDEVPRAERSVPDGLWDPLNGLPYMVKHTYTPLMFTKDFDNYPYRQRSRDVDKRVSDYLTLYLPKPLVKADEVTWEPGGVGIPDGNGIPAISIMEDRYRLYSPFLNVVVNGIINGLITIPEMGIGETLFIDQDVHDAIDPYKWWIKYDPIHLKYDLRYFIIAPFANFGQLTVTSKELLFINRVNELYLDSAASIEGYFLINDNIRP